MGNPATAEAASIEQKIRRLQGPILILGASGFIGANLMRLLIRHREDVYGTTTRTPAWRLETVPAGHVQVVDLLVDSNADGLLASIKPRTIFDCVAYGAYSFETDSQLIYQTNFNIISRLLPRLEAAKIAAYIHAGSSSEYGDNAAGPEEARFHGAQQPLRGLEGRDGQPALLLREEAGFARAPTCGCIRSSGRWKTPRA